MPVATVVVTNITIHAILIEIIIGEKVTDLIMVELIREIVMAIVTTRETMIIDLESSGIMVKTSIEIMSSGHPKIEATNSKVISPTRQDFITQDLRIIRLHQIAITLRIPLMQIRIDSREQIKIAHKVAISIIQGDKATIGTVAISQTETTTTRETRAGRAGTPKL